MERVKKAKNSSKQNKNTNKPEKAKNQDRAAEKEFPRPRQGFISFLRSLFPLNKQDRARLSLVSEYLEPEQSRLLKKFLKSRRARFELQSFETSRDFLAEPEYLAVSCNVVDSNTKKSVEAINKRVVENEKKRLFQSFAPDAYKKMLGLIAPNIIGLDSVKKAGLIQLFADSKLHILLLGDPATGKTDIARSLSELAPKSSFGLGSGSSKAGLTLTMSGKEVVKGLLPMADQGVACIDELNLLRNVDRAGLLNAMEKGFVTYDKGNTHIKVDARINVFATANPEGDQFVGRDIGLLKKQVPFDSALLSRFHLVFLIRKPDVEEFLKITDQIIKGKRAEPANRNIGFAREYIGFALKNKAEFDKQLSELVQGFVSDIKKDENKFLIEISPRIVIGIINMSKAAARMRLAGKVEKKDVVRALKLFKSALYVKHDQKQ